jgi:hypothetical protein
MAAPTSDSDARFVEVWALDEDRFAVRAPGQERIVTGFDEAERTAGAAG